MMTIAGTSDTAFVEYPVVFKAGREDLYGIVVEPTRVVRDGAAVVLVSGAGVIPMSQRNRMWARLARRLAADGFPVLRFDWHGIGESTGSVREYYLDRPFVEDLLAAVRWLERDRPLSTLILVGTCFGARTVLAAGEQLRQLRAAVLLSTPLRSRRRQEGAAHKFADTLTIAGYIRRAARVHVLRRMMDSTWRGRYWRVARVKAERIAALLTARGKVRNVPHTLPWLSRSFVDNLRMLPQRNIETLLVYGTDDEYYRDFQQAMTRELGGILSGASHMHVEIVPGALHGFTTLTNQEVALDRISSWIITRYPRYAAGDSLVHPISVPAGEPT